MSQEQNVETIRLFTEAWNSRDRSFTPDLLKRIDPDHEIHSPLSSVAGQPYCGVEGVRQWLSDIDEQFDVWEGQNYEIRALGDDRLLIFSAVHTRGRVSGVELDWQTAILADFREGRLLRLTIYGDRAEALKALGLEG